MLDLTGKEEIFLTNKEDVPSNGKWEEMGKPIVWLKVYDKNEIVIWEDRAYARLKLITEEGENIGWDCAVVGDIIAHNTLSEDEGIKAYVPYKRIR